jgi:hypothetical protein
MVLFHNNHCITALILRIFVVWYGVTSSYSNSEVVKYLFVFISFYMIVR